MHLRVLGLLTFLTSIRMVVSQFKCDYRMYGRPSAEDCASTFLAMPEAKSSASSERSSTFRHFVEPQLLEPPFSMFENDLGAAMEQLPKFWRYKNCRFALMATAAADGQVIDAGPASTWAYVERETLKVLRNCVGVEHSGGLVLVADPVNNGALSMYVYAVGSPFEAILNNYMITSQALHPPNLLGVGAGNGTWRWVADDGRVEAAPAAGVRLLQSLG